MEDYFNGLQEKYEYSDDLMETLHKIIPAFIEHFGKEHEKTILDAISNCEIHLQKDGENARNYYQEYFPDMEAQAIPATIVGFSESMPIDRDGKFYSKDLIYMCSTDLNDEKVLATLVHEMGHLVKSYNNKYQVEKGKLKKREGIAKTNMDKDGQTGKYSNGEEFHTGIEEAINCDDESKIMSRILGREYISRSYFGKFNESAQALLQNEKMVKALRNAQLNGTDEHLQYFGHEKFEELSQSFDNLYNAIMHPMKAKRENPGKSLSEIVDEAEQKAIINARELTRKKEDKSNDFLTSLQGLVKEQIDLDGKIVQESNGRSIDAI